MTTGNTVKTNTVKGNAIKTAIVGYGFSARTFHIPFLETLAEFDLLAVSSSQGELVRQQLPDVSLYANAEAMLTDSDAELVIITAPNDVHFPLAKLALQCNKHVLLEKPFVTSVAQGEELIALAAEKKRVLTVYQNRRWDGDFLTVKKLIAENRLGNIRYYESHFDRFRPQVRQRWRETAADGGGILYDLGPHLLDQALQLFGRPAALTARCRAMRADASTTDFFHLLLDYADKQVVLHASPFCAGPNLRFQLQGDQGSYVKYGLDPQEDRLRAGVCPDHDHWGDEVAADFGTLYRAEGAAPVTTESGGYQQFFRQLAAAIRRDQPPPVSAVEALWTIELIELAIDSSRRGVTLALD
ncbi:MAG: oxidoreductase [Gammaproteobacteria bacterium]|nr:oxidoreductase [Gammaproteobacteria bacterium]